MTDWYIQADGGSPGKAHLPGVDASASVIASKLILVLMQHSHVDPDGHVIISSTEKHRVALVISAIANRVYTLDDLSEMDLLRFGEAPDSSEAKP